MLSPAKDASGKRQGASTVGYCQQFFHFEPSLDALTLRPDGISSIKILSLLPTVTLLISEDASGTREDSTFAGEDRDELGVDELELPRQMCCRLLQHRSRV